MSRFGCLKTLVIAGGTAIGAGYWGFHYGPSYMPESLHPKINAEKVITHTPGLEACKLFLPSNEDVFTKAMPTEALVTPSRARLQFLNAQKAKCYEKIDPLTKAQPANRKVLKQFVQDRVARLSGS